MNISEDFARGVHTGVKTMRIVGATTVISLGLIMATEIRLPKEERQPEEDPSCTTIILPEGKIARVALNKVENGPNLPDNIRCKPLK